uniref:Sulfotransferase domain-containing protein n=1 Tax=Aureoumbra lagunensis TaxID=44058 RepID=A0A7S3NGV2_9STRA|mmetsp:Transcript_6835/g.9564  ORF Transcript_6835/g.9564 Transcript_6835/m.9564 type:complete len:488 (-) Transcript_6835:329-1792(-)
MAGNQIIPSRHSWLDMTLAIIVGALIGAFLLRYNQASSVQEDEALRQAVHRRDAVAQAIEKIKAELAMEGVRQREEIHNLSVSLGGSWQPADVRARITNSKIEPEIEHRNLIGNIGSVARKLSRWSDFPCTLRDLKVARVTKTCEIACREFKCERAQRLCDRLVECDAVLVKPSSDEIDIKDAQKKQVDLSSVNARLVRDVAQAKTLDASLQALSSSRWWQSRALQNQVYKPRTYVVISYGGCGSKMLAGWLSSLEAQSAVKRPSRKQQPITKKSATFPKYVKRVYHLHDAHPPLTLRELPPPRAPPTNQKDFRARRFPGGGHFRSDTPLIPESSLDDYRLLFIFKDPVEALVSRYGYGHCLHLGGNCGTNERTFPKLDAYARRGIDNMNILSFFKNYVTPNPNRSFPIILLNYHKLWDNLDALMAALGLPPQLASTFPQRTETVRNDLTAQAEGNQAHSEATRQYLDKIYDPIIQRIRDLPAVTVV